MDKLISKPWGHEQLLEHNPRYVLKRLFMKAGQRCSLQYHEHKMETIYVLEGYLQISTGSSVDDLATTTFKPGESLTIPPGLIHRMHASTDCLYLEASTSELQDVIRLSDDYSRI